MLGQSGYDLFANNCEHFATWCVTGQHSSAQIERAAAGVGMVGVGAVVPSVGVGLVTTLGEAAALSGPKLMSGLAAVGGTVVGEIMILGAGTGLLTGGIMCVALRDKPTLTDEERAARRVGRYGAIGGMAQGVLAALFIPALFAAGIGYLLSRGARWFIAPSPDALPPGASVA